MVEEFVTKYDATKNPNAHVIKQAKEDFKNEHYIESFTALFAAIESTLNMAWTIYCSSNPSSPTVQKPEKYITLTRKFLKIGYLDDIRSQAYDKFRISRNAVQHDLIQKRIEVTKDELSKQFHLGELVCRVTTTLFVNVMMDKMTKKQNPTPVGDPKYVPNSSS